MLNKFLAILFLAFLASCSSTQISHLDNKSVSENPVLKTDLFADLLLKLDASKVNDQRGYFTDERYLSINNTNSRAAKIIE